MKLTLLREPDAFGVGIPARDAAPVGAPHAAIFYLGAVLPGTGRVFTLIRRLSPPSSVPRPAIEGSPS